MATTHLRGTFLADSLGSVNPLEFVGLSQFEEQRTVKRTILIDLKSVYGLSTLRDVAATAGSGAIVNTVGGGEYALTTTANGADSASLDSVERGRYVAGFSGEAGMGVRLSATLTGAQTARWGYFDASDGFGFGQDATGPFVFVRKGGVDDVTRQEDWNNDRLDGSGGRGNPSRMTYNPAVGNVFQIEFTYDGYGSIYFVVLMSDATGRQRKMLVHRYKRPSSLSVNNPNLPLRASVSNNGTAAALVGLYVGGRQFAVVGEYRPNRRVTSERRIALAGVGATVVPIISMRRKAAYVSVSVKIDGFDIHANADMIYEVRSNGALTGASFGTPTNATATETALESDIAATAIIGGSVIYSGLVTSGQSNNSGSEMVREIGFESPALQPVTLCARSLSGTGTVTAVLRLQEEW